MIKSFKCKETEKIFYRKYSKKFSAQIQKRALFVLRELHYAKDFDDIKLVDEKTLRN